jgi:VanZ family protein
MEGAPKVGFPLLVQAWLPVLIWMVVIFLFSNQPYSGAVTERYFGTYNVPVRKISHALEYAILYLLSQRAFRMSGQKWHSKATLLGLALACFYALTDEWHQSFVPGRSATLSDAGIDSIGALCACVVQTLSRKVVVQKQ